MTCITSVIVLFLMNSCAVKTHFLTSSVVPAAQGTVQIKKDKNQNHVIIIDISNLAPSTRLIPPYNAYVVWLVSSEDNTINLGQLNTSYAFMSNNLNAKFETISSLKPAKIVITAENDPSIQYSSFSTTILTTDYLNNK